MKSILKFCQRYMEVAILIASQYQVPRLNTTTPQNKRDKPGSSFSVDMACQGYGCLT